MKSDSNYIMSPRNEPKGWYPVTDTTLTGIGGLVPRSGQDAGTLANMKGSDEVLLVHSMSFTSGTPPEPHTQW